MSFTARTPRTGNWSERLRNSSLAGTARHHFYLARKKLLSARIRAVGRFAYVGELDYKQKRLRVVAETDEQLKRLGSCFKEPETVAWIQSTLRANDVFYDVGANIGAYSLVACAQDAIELHVYSFEPGFSSYSALCRNVILNNFQDRIVPINVALSDQDGLGTMEYSSFSSGAALHRIVGRVKGTDDARCATRFSVLCARLDELIERFGLANPTVIKIDVDGGELAVIRGARRTLALASMRSLLVEVDVQSPLCAETVSLVESSGLVERARHRRGLSTTYNIIYEKPVAVDHEPERGSRA